MHRAAFCGHVEVVRVLAEFHADVNAKDSDGWTPMHQGCRTRRMWRL